MQRTITIKTLLFLLLVIGFSGVVSGQDEADFYETKRLAERGLAFAQVNLGLMYDLGEGVPENDAEAVRWYGLARSLRGRLMKLQSGIS